MTATAKEITEIKGQRFFYETGIPVLDMDLTMQMFQNARELFTGIDSFHTITVGASDTILEIPMTI